MATKANIDGNSAEGDWQRRHRKRAAAVSIGQADPCYVALYYELLLVHKCMPRVPDRWIAQSACADGNVPFKIGVLF